MANYKDDMRGIDNQLVSVKNKGKSISPTLPKSIKNYLIDIDGTVCEDIPNEESDRMIHAKPHLDALETINKWYENGHRITFFTSRTENLRELTEKWLKDNGFKYHAMIMDKPRGGNYHWIDSRSVKVTRKKGNFNDMVKKALTIEFFKSKDE